jgi:hypothetical protein
VGELPPPMLGSKVKGVKGWQHWKKPIAGKEQEAEEKKDKERRRLQRGAKKAQQATITSHFVPNRARSFIPRTCKASASSLKEAAEPHQDAEEGGDQTKQH